MPLEEDFISELFNGMDISYSSVPAVVWLKHVLQFLSFLSGMLMVKGQRGAAFAMLSHGLVPLSLAATQERKNQR